MPLREAIRGQSLKIASFRGWKKGGFKIVDLGGLLNAYLAHDTPSILRTDPASSRTHFAASNFSRAFQERSQFSFAAQASASRKWK